MTAHAEHERLDTDCAECMDMVSDKAAAKLRARDPEVGGVVRVVNPDSCFRGLHGTVEQIVERTAMVRFADTGILPFGFSELAIR